jgi:hypothetical protein
MSRGVIGDFVQLKGGRNFKGLSPFSDDALLVYVFCQKEFGRF